MGASGLKDAAERADKLPMPQRAVRAIQDLVRKGVYPPGQRLPSQRVLAEELQVSRASLREALSTLEALGFVKTEAGRGTYVVDHTPEGAAGITEWRFSGLYDLAEVYEFRYLMEPLAVRLAAIHITDEELTELRALYERYKTAIQSLDLIASSELDDQFHRLIMRCTRNRVFVDLYEKFHKVFQETQMLPFSRHERRWEPVMEHGKIVEALERRDPDGAAYYMSIHMVRATDRIGVTIRSLV